MVSFEVNFSYDDRASKAKYVWEKYKSILQGQKILDVGADQCHLKEHMDVDASYWGVGLGGNPDQQVDLEQNGLPFEDDEFDVVLCLDVLEHLENIHQVFDDLCRVARKHVIISLPNPLRCLWKRLCSEDYQPGQMMKFYGLPLEPPEDRHKWFFDAEEAERFIYYRAGKNGMHVVHLDFDSHFSPSRSKRGKVKALARRLLLRKDLELKRLYSGRLWAVLEKTVGDRQL